VSAVDRYKRKSGASPEKQAKAGANAHVDVFDYLLDGSFCRQIVVDDEPIYYVPLTLAEESECSSDKETVTRMLAKALAVRTSRGVEHPAEFLIDEKQSYFRNVELYLAQLPSHTTDAIFSRIEMDMNLRMGHVVQLFTENMEKHRPRDDDKKRRQRAPNTLDGFITINQTFRKTGYTVHDIADMTRLQYFVYSQSFIEANIRESNDHNDLMGKASVSDTKLPGKKSVGRSKT